MAAIPSLNLVIVHFIFMSDYIHNKLYFMETKSKLCWWIQTIATFPDHQIQTIKSIKSSTFVVTNFQLEKYATLRLIFNEALQYSKII